MIEQERPPAHFHGNVGHQRERILQPPFADIAPGADHIGKDVDLQRLEVAHGRAFYERLTLKRRSRLRQASYLRVGRHIAHTFGAEIVGAKEGFERK
jgi:hypothetical protein